MNPSELLDHLAGLGLSTETHTHEAVFTVEESAPVKAAIAGAHSKNLFLKDRRGRLFLVVAEHDTRVDLKTLHERVGASGRLSFGSADLLREVLGVEPGSVTPFALVHDRDRRVSVVLDELLMRHPLLNFHPLANTMTTSIANPDFLAFLKATGYEPAVIRLGPQSERAKPDCMASGAAPS
ncbi:prolyl-tRNA synthetase associated domain-containing protein [uncultured Enterovirga sp.]|uniref:prolyl-tRNA synthetase associated domain-containing protein n=1 Tax=uncultured Enterovirga sp. TaxID=2026352 RepID=UPI0035CB491E